jgi:hypothetical protein
MNPRVRAVKPLSDYILKLTFTNGEVRTFDVKPYLSIGIFQELKETSAFNTVKPFLGSIQWDGGQDFCPDTLFLESKRVRQRDSSKGLRKMAQGVVKPGQTKTPATVAGRRTLGGPRS